jgi:hypothetical protein
MFTGVVECALAKVAVEVDMECDARSKGRSEHLSLERTQRANSLGRAPDSFLPQGTSGLGAWSQISPNRNSAAIQRNCYSHIESVAGE